MSAASQRVTLATLGHLDSLSFTNAAPLTVGPHEVEIEVDAVALNFKDVLLALGLVPTADGSMPRFGFECAGSIKQVGAAVTRFTRGDEVLAIGSSCLATSVCVAAETVQPRPQNLDPHDAVTLPIAMVTASYALEELARLRAGERVLIHAAAGGVGLAAVQIAQSLGAQIFATAGSEEKREYLRKLGIVHVMDSRSPAFAEEVLAQTQGAGIEVILNSLSGELFERSLAVLAPHGRFVELGARDAIAGRTVALACFARGASFCTVGYTAGIPCLGVRFAEVVARVAQGELRPLPKRVFASAEVGAAFSYLVGARQIGKVVVALREATIGAAALDDELKRCLLSSEGVELFERCLSAGRARAIVSKTPLGPRLSRRGSLATRLSVAHAGEPGRGQGSALPRRSYRPRPPLDVAFVAPRSEMESRIALAWSHHLEIDTIGVNDDFFALGGDSLLAVQLAHQLRSSLKVELPTHLLLENPTVAALATCLDPARAQPDLSRHLVRLATGPAATRPLFLIHPIGGHVYFYLPLASRLGHLAPVYGLQAQGVDGEAPPLSTIEEMATGYLRALRALQPTGPYRLGGASFGGVVAAEMACQLRETGEAVELLALIDSPLPSTLPPFFRTDAEILAYLLARGEIADTHLKSLVPLSEDEMLRYFLRHGGAAERLEPDATIASVRHFLQLFRANYNALLRYQVRACSVDALLFRATDADAFSPAGIEHAWLPFFQSVEVFRTPGNHTTMNLPPHVDVIALRLGKALEPCTVA